MAWAVMSRQLLQHEEIRQYTTIWMDTVRRSGQSGLSNTNKLIRFYQGATGLKTGYTAAAGHWLSAARSETASSSSLSCSTAPAAPTAGPRRQGVAGLRLCQLRPRPAGDGRHHAAAGQAGRLRDGAAGAAEPADPHRQEPAGGRDPASRAGDGLTAPIEAGQVLGPLIVESGEQELARIELVAEAAMPGRACGRSSAACCGISA